jgi:hypothetical protein
MAVPCSHLWKLSLQAVITQFKNGTPPRICRTIRMHIPQLQHSKKFQVSSPIYAKLACNCLFNRLRVVTRISQGSGLARTGDLASLPVYEKANSNHC